MLRTRKAQSLSMNTIIIAAIGLAVLVVLFAIFTGRIGIFVKGVDNTDTCEQKCTSLTLQSTSAQNSDDCRANDGKYVAGEYSDVPKGSACCCV